MTPRASSLERRLLRSHLAVAAIGAFMLLIAVVATTWLRSNNLRLASLRGPTVRATALASNGLHQSAEALYGWVLTQDESFPLARARAWRDHITPAAATLERLGTRGSEPVRGEHLERLAPVLADLHDWQSWIEDIVASEGGVPALNLLEGRGRRLAAETTRLARSVTELVSREQVSLGYALAAAVAELDGALRLTYVHLNALVRGDASAAAAVYRELGRARDALTAFALLPPMRDPEIDALVGHLERAHAGFEVVVERVIGETQRDGWNIAQSLLVNQAIPTTLVATQLLTALSVEQEELMLVDAARVEWISNATVAAGVVLLLTLVLTAVIASRRHAARITHPIAELSHATVRIARGDFDGALPTRGDDELAKLSEAFNSMRAALRERSEALQRSRSQLRSRNKRLRKEVKERRRAEQALERRTAELERANGALERRNAELDEFTYVASHDLQEPLRKMLSFSQLLKIDMGVVDIPERAARDLDFITRAAARMQCLVQDLLRLSRAGRSAMNLSEVRLDDCVDAAIEQLEVQIAETGADISREGLPSVRADSTLMTQLFQNLIGNAIKFHPPGRSPVVEITHEYRDGESIIGVRDHGIGLKPEYGEQIFTPFKRLHGRDAYEGTGIGLAICRKAVVRHGGRIWVESSPGNGAHFRFTLGTETRMDECRRAA